MQVEMSAHRTEARNAGQPNQILENLHNNEQSKTNNYLHWLVQLLMMTRATASMVGFPSGDNGSHLDMLLDVVVKQAP